VKRQKEELKKRTAEKKRAAGNGGFFGDRVRASHSRPCRRSAPAIPKARTRRAYDSDRLRAPTALC
jgi:hypothetical protein